MATARDLIDRHIVITGANTGIGAATARALAVRGATLTLVGRSRAKTQPILDELAATSGRAVEFVELDLGDLASVRAGAAELAARPGPIHVLLNNAGLAGVRGQTKDGFELAFGTNHLGHFLLTTLVLPRLHAAGGGARIVNVSSQSHYQAKGIDWDAVRSPTRSVTAMHEYAVSKLANVLFTKELARRLPADQIAAYALHPGVIASDIWSRRIPRPLAWLATRFMKSTEDGARTSIHCATAAELAGVSGRYYDDCKERRPNRAADDVELAAELWRRSEAWTAADTTAK